MDHARRRPRDPSRPSIHWAPQDDLTRVREYIVQEILTDAQVDALLEAEAADAAAEAADAAAETTAGAPRSEAAAAPSVRLVDYDDDDDDDDAPQGETLSPMQRAGARA